MAVLEMITEQAGCIRLPGQRLPVWFPDSRSVILFDSGLPDFRDDIVALLDGKGLRLRAIMTSHVHLDHTGNHAFLRREYGAEVWMTELDACFARTPEALMQLFPNFGRENLLANASDALSPCDGIIEPGQTEVTVCGERFGVIPLPGHTPSQVGYIFPDGVRYLADLLVSERTMGSIRYPFSLCWAADLAEHRRALDMPRGPAIIAHSEICRDPASLAKSNLEALKGKLQALLESIENGDSVCDVTHRCYAADARRHAPFQLVVTEKSIRCMLEYLADIGCVSITERCGAIHLEVTGVPVSV